MNVLQIITTGAGDRRPQLILHQEAATSLNPRAGVTEAHPDGRIIIPHVVLRGSVQAGITEAADFQEVDSAVAQGHPPQVPEEEEIN